jgi:hypothetical protein
MTEWTDEPLWGTPDPGTTSTVETVDADWRRDLDRAAIDDAIRRVAARDGGLVNPNAVRAHLVGVNGELTVNPRALSARYMALSHAGILVDAGEWVLNTDTHGRNSGKPIRLRRYVPERAA